VSAENGITAGDVQNVKFTATKFHAGYDVADVEDLLDWIEAALRRYESAAAGPVPYAPPDGAKARLTAAELREHRQAIGGTKFREGYASAEVDTFLDAAATTLARYEAAPPLADAVRATPPSISLPAPATNTSALGLRELTAQLQFTSARLGMSDTVTVVLPDGAQLRVVAVARTPDEVQIHVAPR
jgi:DivIVA domain-containing protein